MSFDLADLQTPINGIELYRGIGEGTWYSKLDEMALERLEKEGKKIGRELRQVAGIPPRYDGKTHHDEDTFLQATMALGPVPITIKAGAGLDYGADFKPRAKNDPENCSAAIKEFGATLEFTPHIATKAFVGGSIGVPGFNVGPRVDLTLVKLRLPVSILKIRRLPRRSSTTAPISSRIWCSGLRSIDIVMRLHQIGGATQVGL